ncbi:hypothetical protein B0A48_01634 [Cryoendolithus antarcticus]|uniref:mRNA N(6)-methyladenine demethylase n=1 Tax=Cryoendolithus antarcticus TaxID=1507870 RepID=A0A1V8TPU9_9PEZI|nr:hypothetical protein B0A48_01634 [Cryoendolithus antarcticus]
MKGLVAMLDPYAKPPAAFREIYKRLQKLSVVDISNESAIVDLQALGQTSESRVREASRHTLYPMSPEAFGEFTGTRCETTKAFTVYEVSDLPGLFLYPDLLPRDIQLQILAKTFHRDLSNPQHLTNVHTHYDVPTTSARSSYFSPAAQGLIFSPRDPAIHKPITTQQFLDKKLRWMTLGGQYDWTNKVYPAGLPPPFPSDIKQLIESLFPMKAEAAIVNLYSPGDTLSLHRDVSEECDQPLASISLGCEGIFLVGLDDGRAVTLRLRSGDAVLMSGDSRFAWHGVPKVVADTCPEWMQDWPAGGGQFEEWRGWMAGKRINLNVRQMFD